VPRTVLLYMSRAAPRPCSTHSSILHRRIKTFGKDPKNKGSRAVY